MGLLWKYAVLTCTMVPFHLHPQPTPPPSTPSETEPVADGAWKEAFDKLKTEFDRFKKEILREMQILTDDLDKERKNRAELQIDVDRLKKAREFRDSL